MPPSLYETPIPTKKFDSLDGWRPFAAWLREHTRVSMGLAPEPARTPLMARIFGGVETQGILAEKVAFESLPGYFVTGNLFRPAKAKKRLAGILCPHGHWPQGRLQDIPEIGSIIARCLNLAAMGAAVFSYDMVGYGDSCQLPHAALDDPHWGLSLMGLQTWNSLRALDFLLTLPRIDRKRIGVTGASGGGTQTFILAAIDDRITISAPIVMVAESFHGGCVCENAPLLRLESNNVELARLAAPRPIFLGSCTGDWTKNVPDRELPQVRGVYQLFGAQNSVDGVHLDAGHNYNTQMREAVYRFFHQHLALEGALPVPEPFILRPFLRDQLVWWGRRKPAAIAPERFKAMWRRRAEAALRPILASPSRTRRELGPLLHHVVGDTPEARARFTSQPPAMIRVEIQSGQMTVHPVAAPRTRPDLYATTYHRTPHAQAVMELLTAIDGAPGVTCLHGRGRAGPWCLLAAALSDRPVTVEADMRGFDSARDASWTRFLDIPSIGQLGGMATIAAVLAGRVTLRGASPAVQRLFRRMGS
ncbi:MAG: acetylxylan esterase [Planctomycetes bacterium]|nr:acetylxylan esterase [Planctomycetota bacterium]